MTVPPADGVGVFGDRVEIMILDLPRKREKFLVLKGRATGAFTNGPLATRVAHSAAGEPLA
jgi:hypothetical protein